MSMYEVGPFQLDVERLLLMRDGKPVALGPKVVETLLALVEHPGDVIAKDLLLERIWPDGFVDEANLVQNIHVLRKTFRRHGSPDPIETVPRRGYRFTASVDRHAERQPEPRSPAAPRGWIAAALAGAALIAGSFVLPVSHGAQHAVARGALSADGQRSYQIGRYYWNLRTRDGVQKSLTFFARMIDTDPGNARGYAALADANEAMGDYCYGTHRPAVYFARARDYAAKALALDPNSAEAHAALGILALDRHDTTLAMRELRRAIALDGSYAPARQWYGIALLVRGRVPEGVVQLKSAANLDPLSVAAIAWLAKGAYLDRRFADAIAYSREALELSPRRTDVLVTLGQSYEAQGDITRAVKAFERFGAVGPYYRPAAAALLAHAYALARRIPEARSELAYARAHAADVDPNDLAAAAAALTEPSVRAGGDRRRPARRTGHTAIYA